MYTHVWVSRRVPPVAQLHAPCCLRRRSMEQADHPSVEDGSFRPKQSRRAKCKDRSDGQIGKALIHCTANRLVSHRRPLDSNAQLLNRVCQPDVSNTQQHWEQCRPPSSRRAAPLSSATGPLYPWQQSCSCCPAAR